MIAIYGSYNGSSIGDTAILIGLIYAIRRHFGEGHIIRVLLPKEFDLFNELKYFGLGNNIEVVVVGNHGRSVRQRGARKLARYFGRGFVDRKSVNYAMVGVDRLLIGGGNLVMDLYYNWPRMLHEVCLIARTRGVPYSFVGVGAGPIKNRGGKRLLERCLLGAKQVVFRDMASRNLCEDEYPWFSRGEVAEDLATLLPPLGAENWFKEKKSVSRGQRVTLAVNVANVYGPRWPHQDKIKYESYLSACANAVSALARLYQVQNIVVVSTNSVADQESSEAIAARLQSLSNTCAVKRLEARTVAEVVTCAQSVDVAICTRLHAALLFARNGVQVYAINYQPKVRDVLEYIDGDACVADFDEFCESAGDIAKFKRQKGGVKSYRNIRDAYEGVIGALNG